MSESSHVENKEQALQKPPLSVARIGGEILAGAGVGLAVTAAILFHGEDCFGIGKFLTALAILVLRASASVFPLVYGPASAIGVYLVGRIGKQTGSFLLTLGCAFAGGLAVMGMDRLVHSFYWSYWFPSVSPWVFPLVLLVPPLMATCAFNWTRRYKEPAPQKPPVSVGRIAAEIVAGEAAGLVALVAVCGTLIALFRGTSELDGLAISAMFFFLFPPLHGLASAVGVYLVGNIGQQTGSFLPTLGFGFLGGCVALFIMFRFVLWIGIDLTGVEKIVLGAFVLFTAPVLATLGFNRTRRDKGPPSP